MPLGDHFPLEVKKTSAVRNVAPGMVIKLRAEMDDGLEHEKRFLIVHVDEETVACVINSEINSFISCRPELLKCQVEIDRETHPFMDWDSHIDCSKVKTYSTTEVIDSLTNTPAWVLGAISKEVRMRSWQQSSAPYKLHRSMWAFTVLL